MEFDVIIANPPFNVEGIIKVPSNKTLNKKHDGKAIWGEFINKSINFLKKNGVLTFITPSIWMKNDHPMFEKISQYKILKLHTLTNTETNKIFHGQAQTPTCYFILIKTHSDSKAIDLYDKSINEYVRFNISSNLGELLSIPLFGASIFKKLHPFIEKWGHLIVSKTNMPKKNIKLSPNKSIEYPYYNIKTCLLNKIIPKLVINYSNEPCVFHGIPKLILAHKMYGFPYYDKSGQYGISNRDNYVIYGKSDNDLKRIKDFLSTKFALYLFEGTRYRMKYLEKYVFQLTPDITRSLDFPKKINDKTIANYFGFTELEIIKINTFYKKQYSFFKYSTILQ